MINVIVSYRVQAGFVEENKSNIADFLADFRKLDNNKFSYRVFLKDDGVTFIHISNYADENIQKEILNTPSFLAFQKKRDNSGLNDSHKVEVLQFIGSSKNLVNIIKANKQK